MNDKKLVLEIYKRDDDCNGYFAKLPFDEELQGNPTFYIPTESIEWILEGIEDMKTSFAVRSVEPYQARADGVEQ